MPLELKRDGAQLFPRVLDEHACIELIRLLPSVSKPGERIFGDEVLARWLDQSSVTAIASEVLGSPSRPVRAILFDKTSESNWALGWHQDRTIAVRERIEVPGFKHWNSKAGAIHAEPPFEIIKRMITARVHLDPVREESAPLLIAPGSHRRGRIGEAEIADAVEQCDTFACTAEAGDVWLYRTAILHA